jgi:hypothetical protein
MQLKTHRIGGERAVRQPGPHDRVSRADNVTDGDDEADLWIKLKLSGVHSTLAATPRGIVQLAA